MNSRILALVALLSSVVAAQPLLTDIQFRSGQTKPRRTFFLAPTQAPKLDGALDDACWKSAQTLGPMLVTPQHKATNATIVRVTCDGKYLYLGFKCDIKPGAKLRQRIPVKLRDGSVWGDDCLDIFFSPNDGATILQVLINSLGAVQDFRNGNAEWNAPVKVATRVSPAGFTAELAMPRSALTLPKGRQAPAIIFGLGRNDRTLGELDSLSLPYGDPAGFLRLVLGTQQAYEAELRSQLTPQSVQLALYADREVYPATQRQAWCRLRILTPASLGEQARAAVAVLDAKGKSLAEQRLPALVDKVVDFALDLTRLPQANMTLRATLVRGDGQEVSRVERALVKAPRPTPKARRIALHVPPAPRYQGTWPVTVGVPIPQGVLWDAERVRLVDAAGAETPLQTEIAARWSRKGSIKWLHCHFTARLGARYFLELGHRRAATPKPALALDEQPDAFIITTGPARFRLLRSKFNGIDQAWFDRNHDGRFDRGEEMFAAAAERGSYMVDQTGKAFWSANDGKVQATVERVGPQMVTLKFEGWHVAADRTKLGKFIVRVSAFAGKPWLRILHTFIITADSTKVRYRDIGFRFSPKPTHAYFASECSHSIRIRKDQPSAYLVQIDDRRYDFWHQGRFEQSGVRSEGWVAAANAEAGVSLMVKDSWQQYPNEFEVAYNELTFHAWPAHGAPRTHTGDHLTIYNAGHLWFAHEGRELDFSVPKEYFDPKKGFLPELTVENAKPGVPNPSVINAMGLAKTHEMLLVLHGASWERAGVRAINAAFQSAPTAIVDPNWVCATEVFGRMAPRDAKRFPKAERAINMVSDKIFRQQAIDRDYGLFNFGDSHHNWNWQERRWSLHRIWRNMHHGWGRWPWLLFARSGDKGFLDWALRNARHVMDVDHCHYTTPQFEGLPWPRGKLVGGICDYKGLCHWSAGARLGYNSAVDPFLWHYYVTGERRGRDVALEHGRALLAHPKPRPHREGAGRSTSAIALYQETWDNDYLVFVERHIDCLLGTQREDGTFPQWENFAPYLQRYVEQTGSHRGRQAMTRWADSELAYPFERRGYHARLNILAHAYFYTHDPKYLARGNHRLANFTEHVYDGPDERFHGALIPYPNSVNESYFLQEVPYYLEAIAEYGKPVTPQAPPCSALRTFNRIKLDGKSLYVQRIFLREDSDAERTLHVAGIGAPKQYRAQLLDTNGRVIHDQPVSIKPASHHKYEFDMTLPKDGVKEYELRILGNSNFCVYVPVTCDAPDVREAYVFGDRGMGVGAGTRFYFMPPKCDAFRIYSQGRPWPNELVLRDAKGKVVDRHVWIRANLPYWMRHFVTGRPGKSPAGLWSIALFVGHGNSLDRIECEPKQPGYRFYFSVWKDKFFVPKSR